MFTVWKIWLIRESGLCCGMASAMAGYKNGGPIFFLYLGAQLDHFKMKPGKDVVWINVPEIKPTKAQSAAADRGWR